MLGLPRQQQLHDLAHRLHWLPPDRLQQHHEPGPCRTAAILPDHVPELPQHHRLGPAPRSTIHSTRSSRLTTAMRAEFALPATSTRTTTPSSSARDAMAATTRTISSTTTCRGMSTTASTVTSVTRAARAVDKMAANRTGVRSESCYIKSSRRKRQSSGRQVERHRVSAKYDGGSKTSWDVGALVVLCGGTGQHE